MGEETLRTPISVRGMETIRGKEPDPDNTPFDLLSPYAHTVSYGTATIEGIPIEVSLDGTSLIIMEPYAHAARHLWGIQLCEPDQVIKREMEGDAWAPEIALDAAYRLARDSPGTFPITVDIRVNSHLKALTVSKYVELLYRIVTDNLSIEEVAELVAPRYLRPIILKGPLQNDLKKGGIGVASLNHAWELKILGFQWSREYMGEGVFQTGAHVYVAPHTFVTDNAASRCNIKGAWNYGGLRTPLKDMAIQLGLNDCIILGKNREGRKVVTEMTGANIFIVKDGVLITPPESRMILSGLTRENILLLGRLLPVEFGLKDIKEAEITLGELLNADEVFAVGSAAKVTPITRISTLKVPMRGGEKKFEPNIIGKGTPGPVTRALQATYFYLERGEPFAFEQTNGTTQKTIVSGLTSRVARIEIPSDRQELVVKQLGVIHKQVFDIRFRPAKKEELQAGSQHGTRLARIQAR